jgi:hypothetical protein
VVDKIESGDYFLKFNLTNKSDGFHWALMAVYGAAQDKYKGAFLSELVRVCSDEMLPLVVGGNFNIIRYPSEKSNDRFNSRWPNLFNLTIEILNLKEGAMPGRQFTWASYADVPTYEKLDRVLVRTNWELKFPLALVQALTRELSDHTPLLLTMGQQHFKGNSKEFRFELGWLLRDNFFDLVTPVWQSEYRGNTAMTRWQNKIRRTKRFLRGWAKKLVSQTRSKKHELIHKLDDIDLKAESLLSSSELDERCHLKAQLQKNLEEEELYWLQCAKETRLLQGDENTKYFQLRANGKHRKNRFSN